MGSTQAAVIAASAAAIIVILTVVNFAYLGILQEQHVSII
jgi:hypothetical protein